MTSSRSLALLACSGMALVACGQPQAAAPKASAVAPTAAAAPAPAAASSPVPVGAASSQAPAAKKETFGRVPCGRLLAVEEIEAAFGREIPMLDVVAEGNCVYEAKGGIPVVDVKFASGPGLRCTEKDGTYLGKPAEKIEGVADQAVFSSAAATVCFVKGTDRVQISLGAPPAEGRDQKSVATELARKAAGRLPLR